LIRDAFAFTNLTSEVNSVAVDDSAAHAGSDVDTLDAHGFLLMLSGDG
jgi:hypothetical protein